MMKNILQRTKRTDEKITLLKREEYAEKDEFGFARTDFVPVQTLTGIVQEKQVDDIDFKGEELNPLYSIYLLPNFHIQTKSFEDYRIEYRRPYETMIMKIIEYNPNLFLRHKRHHIKMKVILEKKYDG